MTKHAKEYIKVHLPYFKQIKRKYRYKEELKDRAWSILSDYVRCRDFVLFGTCVARGTPISDWHEGDAGHYFSMAGHRTELGFFHLNVHLQSKNSNQISGASDGAAYEKELIRRYGNDLLYELERLKHVSIKADDWYFIKKIEEIQERFMAFKRMYYGRTEYPDYVL